MAKTTTRKPPGAKRESLNRPAETVAPETRITQIDRQLADLLQARARLVLQLAQQGEASVSQAAQGFSPANLDDLGAHREGPLPETCVAAVFREVVSGCRSLVRRLRVAYLGPEYSYSHMAAIQRFGQSVEYVPVGNIGAVFEEVHRGQSDVGLVPVENSTDGRVADTLDMFTRVPVRICGEVEMRIHHALLGQCPRAAVQEVYSRPQALSQCRNWLAKHLPGARLIEVTSTSTAAQLAQEKPGAAAIASLQAGTHYGLDVLAERIEDNPSNTTRFAVIGNQELPRSGNDRTAMLFQTEHRPGALADAMNVFKRNRVNLTWIESFPVPGPERAYLFFVEMEGHHLDTRVRRAVSVLERKTLRMEILGSFPVSPTAE